VPLEAVVVVPMVTVAAAFQLQLTHVYAIGFAMKVS
jgi:hypothetical protein